MIWTRNVLIGTAVFTIVGPQAAAEPQNRVTETTLVAVVEASLRCCPTQGLPACLPPPPILAKTHAFAQVQARAMPRALAHTPLTTGTLPPILALALAIPAPATHAMPGAIQDTLGSLARKRTPLARIASQAKTNTRCRTTATVP